MNGEPIKYIKNRKYIKGKFSKKTPEDYTSQITVGQTYGVWRVVSSEVLLTKQGPKVLVECPHGQKHILLANLKRGVSTKCLKCPKTGLKDYKKLRARWQQIIKRCYDERSPVYHRYGGRGITVSQEFKDPRTFCSYVNSLPRTPDQYHLDRIDNDKGYERGNLRWSTPKENNRNKENHHYVTLNGIKMCKTEFIEKHTQLSRTAVENMVAKGISYEEISRMPKGTSLRYYKRTGEFKVCRSRWSNIP